MARAAGRAADVERPTRCDGREQFSIQSRVCPNDAREAARRRTWDAVILRRGRVFWAETMVTRAAPAARGRRS